MKLLEESYGTISVEHALFMKMAEEVVGPYMLIIGILLGIGGVFGVVYWIKKNTKATDQEVFGLQSSSYEKNDMMVKFYT